MGIKVLTTVDFLKGYEKRNYIKGGKVIMYSLIDDIKNVPSYKEILEMDLESGRNLINAVREKHSIKVLTKHWGVSDYIMYNSLYKKFNIPVRQFIKKSKSDNKNNNIVDTIPDFDMNKLIEHEKELDRLIEQQRNELNQAAIIFRKGVEEILVRVNDEYADGLRLKLKGKFSGKQISDRVLVLAGALTESNNYQIMIDIQEVTNNEENG